MATIEYKFSDGHIEEIEVTEEFAKQYMNIFLYRQSIFSAELQLK